MDKRILLIDDDRAVREALGELLESEGYRAVLAASGKEGIRIAKEGEIHLALLDLNLPEQDGWTTFEALNSALPDLPVIIITARSNQIFSALAAEAVALMEKPLDLEALLAMIRRILYPQETETNPEESEPTKFHYSPAVGNKEAAAD